MSPTSSRTFSLYFLSCGNSSKTGWHPQACENSPHRSRFRAQQPSSAFPPLSQYGHHGQTQPDPTGPKRVRRTSSPKRLNLFTKVDNIAAMESRIGRQRVKPREIPLRNRCRSLDLNANEFVFCTEAPDPLPWGSGQTLASNSSRPCAHPIGYQAQSGKPHRIRAPCPARTCRQKGLSRFP